MDLKVLIGQHTAALKAAESAHSPDEVQRCRAVVTELEDRFLGRLSQALRASVEPRIAACENIADLVVEMETAIGGLRAPSDASIGKLQAELQQLERDVLD
jgi:hypothetical protein